MIPAPLDAVLPKVKAGMPPDDVKAVLAVSNPGLERQDGPWSGPTGYVGFRLDDRYSVLIAAHFDPAGRAVASAGPAVSVIDRERKERLDISRHPWGTAAGGGAPGR